MVVIFPVFNDLFIFIPNARFDIVMPTHKQTPTRVTVATRGMGWWQCGMATYTVDPIQEDAGSEIPFCLMRESYCLPINQTKLGGRYINGKMRGYGDPPLQLKHSIK